MDIIMMKICVIINSSSKLRLVKSFRNQIASKSHNSQMFLECTVVFVSLNKEQMASDFSRKYYQEKSTSKRRLLSLFIKIIFQIQYSRSTTGETVPLLFLAFFKRSIFSVSICLQLKFFVNNNLQL